VRFPRSTGPFARELIEDRAQPPLMPVGVPETALGRRASSACSCHYADRRLQSSYITGLFTWHTTLEERMFNRKGFTSSSC
jgi:hypothetical protein